MSAGIALGPSVPGEIFTPGYHWLFPPHPQVQLAYLQAVSTLSLGVLLLVIGFDTDLRVIGSVRAKVTAITIGGIVVPGAIAVWAIATLLAPLKPPRASFAIFVAFLTVGVAVTSLPLVARMVSELGMIRRTAGQLGLGIGTLNEILGFLAMAVLAGMITAKGGDPWLSVLETVGSGAEGALGVFAVGIVLGRSRFDQPGALERLREMSDSSELLHSAPSCLHGNQHARSSPL